MALEEKVYTIPLRSQWVKKSRVARANVSVDTVRLFLLRHTKTENVKLSQALNESLWVRGAKKPPAFAKVKVVRDDKGKVTAMLPEEKLEITEKKGLRHKLLRRKGETETKIVMEDKAKEQAAQKDSTKTAEDKKPETSVKPEAKKEEPTTKTDAK